jgi:mono/diheme cytochrome c family protein
VNEEFKRLLAIFAGLLAAMLLLVACQSTSVLTAVPTLAQSASQLTVAQPTQPPAQPSPQATQPPAQPTAEPTQSPAQPTAEPTQSPAQPTAEPSQPPAQPTTDAATATPQAELFAPPEKPSAERGSAIFAANCAVCHGAAGDGSGLPGAANFTDPNLVRNTSPADFFVRIRDGFPGTAMPAWGGTLSEMEMWDVLYYERSFATSPQQVAQGKELFTANCVICHGAAGDGSGLPGAANFTDEVFISDKTPQRFFTSITNGVSGSAMPAWGQTFSQDQIWALVSYVDTFAYDYGQAATQPAVPTSAPPTAMPQATSAGPTQAPEPTSTPTPTPTPTLPLTPSPAVGQQLWQQLPCLACHGAQAQGLSGPRLAGTSLSFDEVLLRVRTGKGPMPAFTEAQVSDQQLENIYAWLESLAPPTPTPEPTQASKPLPPSGHLMAFWEHVNTVKVKSDFAKDASPDIGALHNYVNQAKTEANGALQEADRAIADIPDSTVRATINQVKGFMNQILSHANAALATNDLNAGHNEAAQMVAISRLDAWPSASLAVKQAGFVGSVRVQVKDQNGRAIRGALVTALTAPQPSAGMTDSNGRVTISNLAAVRAMQIKAYGDNIVYHEVHVTIPVGGRADAEIVLPGASIGGQVPVASNASISPSSGAGNARVTFRLTGTDPQGHDNIAEDQVFALNPDLGFAYVLRSAVGDAWQTTVTLPNLSRGTHTWYFFVVDHQCNTSHIIPLTYTVR